MSSIYFIIAVIVFVIAVPCIAVGIVISEGSLKLDSNDYWDICSAALGIGAIVGIAWVIAIPTAVLFFGTRLLVHVFFENKQRSKSL